MGDRFKEVVLSGNRLSGIEQRELAARRVTDLEGALVEIARTRPETIGARPIACAIDPVTPHALRKVDALSRFDHLGGRLRGEVALFEPCGKFFFGSDQ